MIKVNTFIAMWKRWSVWLFISPTIICSVYCHETMYEACAQDRSVGSIFIRMPVDAPWRYVPPQDRAWPLNELSQEQHPSEF